MVTFLKSTRRELWQLVGSSTALLPLFALSYWGAYQLRFAGNVGVTHQFVLLDTLVWVLAIKLVFFVWFRVHQGWTHYVTFHDLLVLGQAVTCCSVGITLLDAMFLADLTIPRSVILLDWGATLLSVGAFRALPRLLHDDGLRLFGKAKGVRSMIVGANNSGEALLRAIHRNPTLDYQVLGFVDDSPWMLGRRIGGVPVIGTCDDIPRLVERYRVEELLITAGELPGKRVRQLLEVARESDFRFRVRVLPSYEQLLRDHVDVKPRPVAIEDLLRRPSVELDADTIRQWIEGQVLLVTGSAGSIGSEICRQLLKLRPSKLVAVDRSETGQFFLDQELRRLAPDADLHTCIADVTDRQRVQNVFQQFRPQVIFHAAAYKHVPLMECHAGEAVKNITLATRLLADVAEQFDARSFVMISTDKAVNPTNIMGACKQLAEQYVQARAGDSACRFVTVRFGNVLDSAGSVVPVFRDQIARGGPVTVTHPDIVRYFMLIPEAAQLVIQAGAMGRGGEIFVLDMGEPVRIIDLAEDMIRLSGLRVGDDVEIEIVGLRAGEKLYEELYGDSEQQRPTPHPKIMVASGHAPHLVQAIHNLNRLEAVADAPSDQVRQELRRLVAFQPTAADSRYRSAA